MIISWEIMDKNYDRDVLVCHMTYTQQSEGTSSPSWKVLLSLYGDDLMSTKPFYLLIRCIKKISLSRKLNGTRRR